MAKIRVLLVDDHDIVRLGLMTLINDRADMQVVGEAGDAAAALEQVEQLKPDVVLMDIRLPGESGIDATRKIATRFPNTKVVMLTSFAHDDMVVHAVAAGAVGYILKKVGNDELLRAIAAAARGEALLDPVTTAKLLSRVREAERQSEKDAFRDLSRREMEVLALIALRARQAVITRNLEIIRSNLAYAAAFIDRHASLFRWLPPQAGSVAFPLWQGPGSVEDFCRRMLDSQGVMIVPGSLFDYPGDHFRVGLGRRSFPDALERVERALVSDSGAGLRI